MNLCKVHTWFRRKSRPLKNRIGRNSEKQLGLYIPLISCEDKDVEHLEIDLSVSHHESCECAREAQF